MSLNTFCNDKQLSFVDMFFTLEEEDIMTIYIFQNVPVEGVSIKNRLEKCVRLLESDFGTSEWLIDFNRNMDIYINGKHYKNLSSFQVSTFDEVSENVAPYEFDLLVTDMASEYSMAEIFTGFSVWTVSENEAIAKVQSWIERKYSHFKELEWYIRKRGKMNIYSISFEDVCSMI